MHYSNKEVEKMIKQYRESLKPDWKKQDWKQTKRALNEPAPSIFLTYDYEEVVVLRKDVLNISTQTLHEVIQKRQSLRTYKPEPLSFDHLSYLCYETSHMHSYGEGRSKRVIPTAGATHSLETYVYVNDVEGVKQGLYHFHPESGNLGLINSDFDKNAFNKSLFNQLRGAPVVFIWSAIPYRGEYKYSYMAHKMIAMEAGHVCQNLYLAAEAIEGGAVAIGSYDQDEVDSLMGFDTNNEFVIYIATVGLRP